MANNCMLLILTLSNRDLKIHVSTDTSWTKVLPQTGRALGFTGSPCSCAAGSAVSTGWGRQRSETEIRTFGSLCEKGPEFLTVISGQCQEKKWHQERHLAIVTCRLSTETCLCIPTSPPGAPTPQGGDTAASQMSHVFGAAVLPPSRKLLRATLILPCLRGCAKQMPLCLLHPPPGSDTFSKCSPQIPPGQVVAESRPKTPHQQGN